jgi:uncharacterized protein YaiE (UPF0345 family)
MSSQLQVTGEAKIRDIQGPVVANSGVITALDGAASQYVRGDGTLADFPTSSGGGSSVSYYLNSSVSQGTIGGVAYRELSKEPIIGAGTDIAISTTGYVASYLTDANDPDVILIPGGNFNCEFYFSVNNNTGNPFFYAELYKYDGTTFTLLGSSVGVPEYINQGTVINPYYFAIPVATANLALTDRLAIRIYVNVDGRTVTLHTENGHLCQVVTTLSKGMVSLNNLTDQSQFITTGTSGTNFNIVSSGDTHTFNLPIASATNTGKLSSTDWSTFNGKVPYTGANADVNLGAFILSAGATSSNIVYANGSGSSSGMLYLKQGTIAANYTGYNGIYATSTSYGFIADTGSSYKLGVFSLASLTDATTRTYTLPDASGTLALTSNLSAYLPLAGGTLTGALSGTSATFSSDILVSGVRVGIGSGGTNNTRVGPLSFMSNTTGSFNTAIGTYTLNANTTGSGNTALGNIALIVNTTGQNNTAIGAGTLGNITTGSNNTGLGIEAGISITTGSNNTIIGNYAGTPSLSNNIVLADGQGNIRYQWNGTNNHFTGPTTFGSSVTINTAGQSILSIVSSAGNSSDITSSIAGVLKSTISTSATEFKLISAIDNILKFQSSTNFRASLIFSNTADYSYTYPNASGTIALLSGTQTFTGATTFSSNITVNTVQVGSAGNTTNIKLGENTFSSITSGSNNIAIGSNALSSITTSNANIGIGNSALASVINGTFNTGIGFAIGASITSGSYNALFGYGAGSSITTGNYNTILGGFAGTAAMSNNIVLADGAGNVRYQWDGTNNVFGNPISATSATFSSSSAAVSLSNASDVWLNITRGSSFVNIGVDSTGTFYNTSSNHRWLYNSGSNEAMRITSSGDVAIGTSTPLLTASGRGNLTINGSSNSLLSFGIGGASSGYIFSSSTALEVDAQNSRHIQFNTNGAERMRITSGGNVGVGTMSPVNYTNYRSLHISGAASNSSAILYLTNSTESIRGLFFAEGSANRVTIGSQSNHDFTFLTNDTERMRITSGGNVGIGTSAPIRRLQVEHAAGNFAEVARFSNTSNRSADDFAMVTLLGSNAANTSSYHYIALTGAADRMYVYGNGNIVNSNNSYGTLSDISLKENIVDATPKLADILNLKVRNFNLIGDDTKQIGFIAQEFEEVFPLMVDLDGKSGKKAIKTSVLVPMLVKAIQEQTQIIKDLEARIVSLESK